MKFKSISQTVPQSVQVLFRVKWETDMYHIVGYRIGYEYLSSETKKPIKGVVVSWAEIID